MDVDVDVDVDLDVNVDVDGDGDGECDVVELSRTIAGGSRCGDAVRDLAALDLAR